MPLCRKQLASAPHVGRNLRDKFLYGWKFHFAPQPVHKSQSITGSHLNWRDPVRDDTSKLIAMVLTFYYATGKHLCFWASSSRARGKSTSSSL